LSSLFPFLTPGHPESSPHCARRCTHTYLLPFPSKLWCPDPTAESTLGEGPSL
jgi:hypothetical protein